MFPAAIGEENEGDTLGLEVGKGFVCARERVGAAGEDTIDAGGRELVWRVRKEVLRTRMRMRNRGCVGRRRLFGGSGGEV